MSNSVISALRETRMVTWKGTVHQRGREGNGGKDLSRDDEAQKSRQLQNLRRDLPSGPQGIGGLMKVGLLPPAFPPT